MNGRLPLLLAGILGLALASACGSPSSDGNDAGTGGTATAGSGAIPRGGVSGAGGTTANPSGGAGGSTGGTSTVGGSSGAGTGGNASAGTGGTTAGSGSGGDGAGGNAASGGSSGTGGTGGTAGSDDPGTYTKPDSVPADETGADLWLRYPEVPVEPRLTQYRAAFKQIVVSGSSATLNAASEELVAGLSGLTGMTIASSAAGDTVEAGSVLVGTVSGNLIKDLPLASRVAALGPEGYLVEAADAAGGRVIVVTGNSELGALYGSFALLRHLASHGSLTNLALSGSPRIQHRLLNHWDNLDRTVERGYAGRSIWDWGALPGTVSPRYKAYARANASIGINGAVLTNVNANADVLTPTYLAKVKAIADVLRPYGIKVWLTARFSAPIEIGNLSTADPTNASVKQWWVTKVNEIYEQIPDFGGFLVKANSEGQPGPQDYDRTHADGANALAAALAPHQGVVIWRAFVYSETSPADRIKQAYEEFKPLDGQFAANVMVQAKNGPLDFQPREPFHPLFGAMPETPLALELQITKEYLGEDTHLAYLGPLFEEVLKADTGADGPGSTVAKIIDGSIHPYATTAISGVSNVGDDVNWTGSQMNQANWYVFGRLAWNPDLTAEAIAEEWVRQTFSNDPAVVAPVVQIMMASRQALVNYMTPLGLVHIMGTDHHYGPKPWEDTLSRPEWNPVYYHKANSMGLGFDRSASGSDAVEQYFSPVKETFGTRSSVPDDYLLFFFHVGWGEQLASGKTLWEELVYRYSLGVDQVQTLRTEWAGVEGYIDAARFTQVTDFLEIQHYEARWWRDACLAYFGSFSNQAIPAGYSPLHNNLAYYKGLNCPSDVKKPRCPAVYTGEPSPAILP